MDGETIDRLIVLVNEYEELYDVVNRNYSNQNRRENIWSEIGKKINESEKCTFVKYDNSIISPQKQYKKIENLESAYNLKNLYLQYNKIQKLENLASLTNLEKLYLGHNQISVVEGLETLNNLKELYLEKQNISDSLCFDERSIEALSECLEILNISHNNITTLGNLYPLKYLRICNASYNNLSDIKDVCDAVYNWYYIHDANFIGNPATKIRQFREYVISSSHKLEFLNNKHIHPTQRSFIKRLEQEKLNKSSKPSVNIPEWTKSYGPVGIHKAVYESFLKGSNKMPYFDNSTLHSNVNDIYLPWNTLPQSKNKVGKFTLPTRK